MCKLISNLCIPSHTRDGLMIYVNVYQTLLFLHTHVMVLWYTHTYIKPYTFLHAHVMVLWYMHTYIKPYRFLHAHVKVLWYMQTYIKPNHSSMQRWWSYDIRTHISNPIIPSRTCDGLMIYAHVYQHPGIYWTCERFRRLDSTLLVPAGKGLSIRTSEGSTVWHLHRQHGGI